MPVVDVVEELRGYGAGRGEFVALALAPDAGVAMATGAGTVVVPGTHGESAGTVQRAEEVLRPRWVIWSSATVAPLVAAGTRVATAWDLAAAHRLLFGGWQAGPDRIWAQLHELPLDGLPTTRPLDLFSAGVTGDDTPDEPVRSDGYLRADWAAGAWATSMERAGRWAALALPIAEAQQARLAALAAGPRAVATARIESAAELLGAELSFDGLPMNRAVAESLIASFVGPRPRSEAEAADQRARRDVAVLQHAPAGSECDLRSSAQVRSLLHRVGIDVPDTRAFRLKPLRDAHPLVGALLDWRRAERVATTYGYSWLDEHVDADGRLRGEWSASDGAAGRMTASAGLHNLPADMRDAVQAEAGHVFVRADLGQIEPRVLAAVSNDRALAVATRQDDMYAPVAQELGVDRATAKVAVLGAMYGQTTGHGAQALRGLDAAYPVAMEYLREADRAAQAGRPLRTFGGRLIALGPIDAGDDVSERDARARAAARGRYGRNAMVQGAAAELFKTWAVTVRARSAPFAARIVLCLHDELLVHAAVAHADAVARLLDDGLQEAAYRFVPESSVRFVAEVSVVDRWSDAKA